MKPETMLRILLRLTAAAELMAVVGVLMPTAWMAIAHAWLGLGEFPNAPVAIYLARHLSALYAVNGGLLWAASCDPRRYAGIIKYVSWAGLVFSVLISVLDIQACFPWYWMVMEGPAFAVLSVVLLVLVRRMEKSGEKASV